MAPIAALVPAMIVDRARNVLDNDEDKEVEKWLKEDKKFEQQKQEMKVGYNNAFNYGNYNSTMMGSVGSATGLMYGRAQQNIRQSYNDISTRADIDNSSGLTDLEISRIANGECFSGNYN